MTMDDKVRLPTALILFFVPVCFQSRNLALHRPAQSDSVLRNFESWSADKAVDGDRNQNIWCNSCLHTDTTRHNDGTPAFLAIDLGNISTIERVEIYYMEPFTEKSCRNGEKDRSRSQVQFVSNRFKGYSIRISDGHVTSTCYTDTSYPYPNLYQNNSCFGTGRQLSIVQEETTQWEDASIPVLQVCEVEVYGCPVGYYGSDCGKRCGKCLRNLCHPDTGVCLQGCSDGWTGSYCRGSCETNYYGQNCSIICGNCFNDSCRNVDGLCRQGCVKGYGDTKCKKACSDGRYGYNCNMTCGRCRDDRPCDKKTGVCPNQDCEEGYTGKLCIESCVPGTFGRNCEEKCGSCKGNSVCNNWNGYCEHGCSNGWIGNKCQTACKAGFYGETCTQRCSGNCYGPCHHENGFCSQGCADGYKGSMCKEECSDGFYGARCSQPCSKNCYSNTTCHHVNGHCLHGCTNSFRGPMCSDVYDKKSDSSNDVIVPVSVTMVLVLVTAVAVLYIKKRKQTGTTEPDVLHDYEMPGNHYESIYEVLDGYGKRGKVSKIPEHQKTSGNKL